MLEPEPCEVWELFGGEVINKIWCGYCSVTGATSCMVVFPERSKWGSGYLNHLASLYPSPTKRWRSFRQTSTTLREVQGGLMAKWRKIRLAAGKIQLQILNQKCRIKDCENYIRKEPGATHCDFHRDLENAGCAAHDRLDCGDCKQ